MGAKGGNNKDAILSLYRFRERRERCSLMFSTTFICIRSDQVLSLIAFEPNGICLGSSLTLSGTAQRIHVHTPKNCVCHHQIDPHNRIVTTSSGGFPPQRYVGDRQNAVHAHRASGRPYLGTYVFYRPWQQMWPDKLGRGT